MTPAAPIPVALIVGGGPAAIEAALSLHALGGPRLRVELLSASDVYVHRPTSVVEPFAVGRARTYPLARLAEHGIRVHHGTAASVDAHRRHVVTSDCRRIPYDYLVMAAGARLRGVVPHAITFGGPGDVEALHGLVQDVEGGWSPRIAFVAPPGASWTLPIYELALQAAGHAAEAGIEAELTLVTHEASPLEAFGAAGAALAANLLAAARIRLITRAAPEVPRAGRLVVRPGAEPLEVDRIVALPLPAGRRFPGLPADADGFLPVDEHGRVPGFERVYGAGDGTTGTVKQGGLATQQAAAAAEAIAADAGLRPAATPFEGVLRAMLITGSKAYFLRRRPGSPDGEVSERALWWPPGKIAGQRLAPFLDGLDGDAGHESVERMIDRRSRPTRRVAVFGRGSDGQIVATAMERRR